MRRGSKCTSIIQILPKDPADGRPAAFSPGELKTASDGEHKHSRDQHDKHRHAHDCSHDHSHNHSHDHSHDHKKSVEVEGGGKDEHWHSEQDLKRKDLRAGFLESSSKMSSDGHGALQQSEVEPIVRSLLDANFHKTAIVKHVTCRFLQGKVEVEVGVSLDLDISIRDAVQLTNDMETCLMRNIPNILAVKMQLILD